MYGADGAVREQRDLLVGRLRLPFVARLDEGFRIDAAVLIELMHILEIHLVILGRLAHGQAAVFIERPQHIVGAGVDAKCVEQHILHAPGIVAAEGNAP